MKREIRTKTVEYNVYIAKDGKEFNSEDVKVKDIWKRK